MKSLSFLFFTVLITLSALSQDDKIPVSNWQQDGPLTPNYNGQTFRGWVDAICVHADRPNEMLIATRTSGLFRTENSGENWVCVTDNTQKPVIGCPTMISLPLSPNYVVAITSNGGLEGTVLLSDDFGKTWRETTQELPPFRWIDVHPTRPELLVACSEKEVFYSVDRGETWTLLGAPADTDFHANEMFKLIVKENSVSLISKARWDAEALLHEIPFHFSKNKEKLKWGRWSVNLTKNYLITPEDKIIFMDFSNQVGKLHYFQFESKKGKRTYKTSDGGLTYSLISMPNFPVGHWWKNELLASPNDSNAVYWGQVGLMKRYDLITHQSTVILNDSIHPGHHDDYRSSHILSIEGKDFLAMGHDGGVGLVANGLEKRPTIVSANGDLSINLIHAFDVHEKTGRIVYAFQDGPMYFRDPDGTFSDYFLWEGSSAMIQQQFPDEIVGESAYSGIMDKDEKIRPIVDGVLGRGGCYLGGYFITYRHFPERFARGLKNGKIAMNRGENQSEVVAVKNVTSDIGAIAICARHPNFMYASATRPDDKNLKLHRSTDDGKTWENLTESTLNLTGEKVDLNLYLHWNYIKSLAVDPDDGNVVYCGLAGTYKLEGKEKPGQFRVIKSVNGGKDFIDFSKGLPAVAVDEILSVESDDGLLFCATVHGIFYRTNDMDQWMPFSNQLPKVEITGLKYDYCNHTLYASTYGRGLWKTKVGFTIPNTYKDEISEDVYWEEDRIQYDHVLVKSGATLTIRAKVEMYKGKEITVEEGGKLILEGGKILEFCYCRF